MRAHRLDPVSAILGLVALIAAILVIGGSTVPFDADVGPWLAIVAVAFGLLLLPWGLRTSRTHETMNDQPDDGDTINPPEPSTTTDATGKAQNRRE